MWVCGRLSGEEKAVVVCLLRIAVMTTPSRVWWSLLFCVDLVSRGRSVAKIGMKNGSDVSFKKSTTKNERDIV